MPPSALLAGDGLAGEGLAGDGLDPMAPELGMPPELDMPPEVGMPPELEIAPELGMAACELGAGPSWSTTPASLAS
jgi:hypothetical protein